jgi:SAM-dependent methyltransferase
VSVPPVRPTSLARQVGRSAFGIDAQAYDEARSGYPTELFDLLASRTVPEPRVAEIGSGTGLASAGLFGLSPVQLTMIEPDPRLCTFLEQRFASPETRIICAPFPEVDIEGKFDLIVCAAAFHWMEPVPALAKVRSLLAPGGVWAMWWNSYFGHGEADAFADKVSRLLFDKGVVMPPSYRGAKHYAFDSEHHISTLRDAGFSENEHVVFRTPRAFTPSEARELYQSFSFIRVLPNIDQMTILERIAAIVEDEFGGSAPSLYATSLFVSKA